MLKAMHLIRWAVPLLMGIVGIAFTLFEHFRNAADPLWPWPTFLGLSVLGIIGPVLSWFSLRWATKAAEAYKASQAQLAERNDELAALYTLAVTTSQSLGLEERLSTALEQTMKTMDAQAGMVFLKDGDRANLYLVADQGISPTMAQKETRLAPGHCLCGEAVKSRQVLFSSDATKDVRCTSDLCICEGFRSVACVPLEVKGQLVGLLQLASAEVGHFNDSQRDFMTAIARQVGVSIENARLYDIVRSLNVDLEQKVDLRTRELEAARRTLAEKARQLQNLLSETYRIQEDTQARISQDMHDGVTQCIIGALYMTQSARQSLYEDPERAIESLAHAQQLLSEVEIEIRRVIYDLHPPVLDQMGLVVALKRFATTYETTFGIECQVQVTGQPRRLSCQTEITIYRIIQAALHNVASHAQANRAVIGFSYGPNQLLVSTEDNGIGFNPQTVLTAPGEHLGLIGMRERAESLGASLIVDSTPGRGTRLEFLLPSPDYTD